MDFDTPGHATAFANPNIELMTDIDTGKPIWVVTSFLMSEGNPPEESGNMIVVYDATAAMTKKPALL